MHFRGIEQNHGFQYRPFGDLVASKIDLHQPDPPSTADGRSTDHAVGRFPFAGPSVIPESLHSDTVVTRESLAWALEFADKHPETPWFLCASYFRPHFPLTAPGRYVRKYQHRELPKLKPPDNLDQLHPHDRFIVEDFCLQHFSADEHRAALAAYYASVDYVDDQIGELLTGFQRSGLLDNTFVVYSSDHGEMAGEHGLWWKRSYYQASVGVPLLTAGPGITLGTRIEEPVELTDLFPTFCSWAGIKPPHGLDGETLIPLIDGCFNQRRKVYAVSEILGGSAETRFRMVRDQRWKCIEFPAAPLRLFDLQNDPGETRDLANSNIDCSADLPLNEIFEVLGDWDSVDRARENDQEHKKLVETTSRAAVHYRLADGREVEGDDYLYDGSSVEE
jgi:choline-sulfatase